MNLTNPEKLILIMLSEIQEKLGIDKDTDIKFLKDAIYNDQTWALSWNMPGIVGDNPSETPPEVKIVSNILTMWTSIELTCGRFEESEKTRIQSEVNRYSSYGKFLGFDGNEESKYLNIADFLINKMGRFSHFEGRDLNSHREMLEIYRNMYEIFDSISSTGNLTADQIITILNVSRN
jgi:uncharacterized protein